MTGAFFFPSSLLKLISTSGFSFYPLTSTPTECAVFISLEWLHGATTETSTLKVETRRRTARAEGVDVFFAAQILLRFPKKLFFFSGSILGSVGRDLGQIANTVEETFKHWMTQCCGCSSSECPFAQLFPSFAPGTDEKTLCEENSKLHPCWLLFS